MTSDRSQDIGDADEELFVLDCTAEAMTATDGGRDVVVLRLTGVRRDGVGSKRLFIRTDDWDGIQRAVFAAFGHDDLDEDSELRWATFAGQLRSAIACLDHDQFLILHTRVGRFVQVLVRADEIRAETVSNACLPRPAHVADDDGPVLEELGWNGPTHELSDDDLGRIGSPNHWVDLASHTPPDVIAGLLIATLREAHGVAEPEDLTYDAADLYGRRLLSPLLGLSRNRGACPPRR